ncbi:MAG TPA: acyltransferase [Edaphobacter sp.]|jgi:peptidoglycan/LPS O-acetylase OafA/YrhL|nr:acyltransferase [Edaphobacter sp.]
MSLSTPPSEIPSPTDARVANAPAAVQDKENPGGFAHIPALDGIRGLAILLVLIDHLFWANDQTGSAFLNLFAQIRDSTYCGVNLFFALSGFLITTILLRTLNVPHYFRIFYSRRTLRIFPLYYGFLFLLLFLTPVFHFVWNGWQYYYLGYIANLALWRSHVPLNLKFFNITHFWSLQVEEQFYLVWPLIVYRVRKPESLVRVSLIGCVVILSLRIFFVAMKGHPHFTNYYLPYSPTFSCADNILFGCTLSALLQSKWRARTLELAPRFFAICFSLLIMVGIVNHGLAWSGPHHPIQFFIPTFGFTLFGITATSLIALCLLPGRAQTLFSNGFLRFFGRYSYGIYVFHFSISGFMQQSLRTYLYAQTHSKLISVCGEALAAGVLSVLVALLSYHLFEVQFLHLKRFFAYDTPQRSAKATAK